MTGLQNSPGALGLAARGLQSLLQSTAFGVGGPKRRSSFFLCFFCIVGKQNSRTPHLFSSDACVPRITSWGGRLGEPLRACHGLSEPKTAHLSAVFKKYVYEEKPKSHSSITAGRRTKSRTDLESSRKVLYHKITSMKPYLQPFGH